MTEKEKPPSVPPTTALAFGDVVQVFSSRNETLHKQVFFISYIDHHKMKLLRDGGSAVTELRFTYDVSFGAHCLLDESIDRIRVVSKAKELGFARQLGLLPETYVDLEFNGDIPQFVTGKITHLHHDMIEITTIPAKTVLYIDFAYQGIPEHLPLRKIRIRDGPPKQQPDKVDDDGVSPHPNLSFFTEDFADASVDWNLEGEMVITTGGVEAESQSYHVLLEKQYLDADRLMETPPTTTTTALHKDGVEFVKELLNTHASYNLCERLRVLLLRPQPTVVKPPKGWIPVWDDKTLSGVNETEMRDGLIRRSSDDDHYTVGRRPANHPVSSWIVLPPSSWCTTFLLEELDLSETASLAEICEAKIIDLSGSPSDFFKKTWPHTTALHRLPANTVVPKEVRWQQQSSTAVPKRLPPVKTSSLDVVDTLAPLLEEQASLVEQFQTTYAFLDGQSSSEKWTLVEHADRGAFLTMLLRLLTVPHLTLSQEMTNSLTERMHKKMADYEDMNHVTKIKAGDCNRRVLTKRYTSLSDVHKDSHHGGEKQTAALYFDAEYDDTPYDLMKPIEEEFGNTTAKPTELEEFVAHTLIDRHNYTPKHAQEVAETMVSRKRRVKEGHYALLETANGSFYYRRTHDDKWVIDKTVDATTFIDTPTLFCNMDKVCMRDASAPLCQTPEDAQIRLRYLEQRRTLKEMQTRMTTSAFHTAKQLETEANRLRQCLKRRIILKYVDLHRFDEYHGALGQQQHADDQGGGVVESPHLALRNRILGDSNVVRRNKRLLDFVVRHCREALGTESAHWWYCNETVPAYPLVPVRLHHLALKWNPQLLSEQAVVEEGAYVDPDTGYTLSGTEFVNDEVEPEPEPEEEEDLQAPDLLRDILYTLASELLPGKKRKHGRDEALVLARELVQEIHTASQYKQVTAPRDGAPFLPYSVYRDRECILRAACALLFVYQTQVHIPGKHALTEGFPLDLDEKKGGGLSIFSALLFKLKSNKRQPWDSLNPWKESTIRQALIVRCRTLLLNKPKYESLLNIQRHKKSATGSEQQQRMSWPIEALRSKQGLEDGFAGHIAALVAQGSRKQHAALDALKSKSWIHAYSVLEEDGRRGVIEACRSWQRVADDVAKKSSVQQLSIDKEEEEEEEEKSKAASSVSYVVRDRTAWSALIRYHHLDQPGPIPDRMRALGWIKDKPPLADKTQTLDEKKSDLTDKYHVKLDLGKFNAMMKVVHQENMVRITEPKHLHKKQVGALRDLLSAMTRGKGDGGNVVLGLLFCQLLDAHVLVGKDDEDTALALMEEISIQRMSMWTLIRQSFARDQVHRIQVLLTTEPRNVNRIRNLTRLYPRLFAEQIPEMMRPDFLKVQQRLSDTIVFLELITENILDASMVDAIFVYTFFIVIQEYLRVGKNSYMSDWIANLLSGWLLLM
jgi:hypothetical protein